MKIAIIGFGFCGKATKRLFEKCSSVSEILIHDPAKGYIIDSWSGVAYAFICVPTPLIKSKGILDVSIIDTILLSGRLESNLDEIPTTVQPVIRSTIGPDQALFYMEQCYPAPIIMPEFLREKHWEADVDDETIPIVIGGDSVGVFTHLLEQDLNRNIIKTNSMTAAMIKVARNSALAMKVALANDFYDICKNTGADYKTLKNFLTTDKNLGGTHWEVPGHDNKKGFGGTCLPKDLTHTSNLCYHTNNIMATAVKANHERRSEDE